MVRKIVIPIGKKFHLIGQEIVGDSTLAQVPDSSNYIFICDVSGSMYSAIKALRETLKRLMRGLKKGDTLTVAKFSGSREYEYFIRAFQINDNQDFSGLDKLVDKHLVDTGLTCYTEVLNEAKNVIDDIQKISSTNNFSLCFLSDGHPNVNSSDAQILKAIENIKGLVNQSFIIGYGRYYNKSLLSKMAENLGASLIHNDNDHDFDVTFKNFIENKPQGKNVLVKIENPADNMFYITPKGEVVRVKADSNGHISYPMSKVKNFIYSVIEAPAPKGATEDVADYLPAAYAAALVYNQSLATYQAMEILSSIGDKFLVDGLSKAFTVSQYGVVENHISEAIKNKKSRFITGQHINCLPDDNAFCLLDLVGILEEDDTLMFYPNDKRFSYNRTSRASEQIDSLEFKENMNDGYKVENITLNATRPNISLMIRKEGKVRLAAPDTQEYRDRENLNRRNKNAGLESIPNQFETFVFRNYSIITDGDYNINSIPVSFSEETFNILKNHGVLGSKERYGKNKIFILEISQLPVVSRKYAKKGFSSKEMAKVFKEVTIMKVEQAVLNYFLKETKPGGVSAGDAFVTKYGKEGAEYLKSLNITSFGGFAPKTKSLEPTDHYLAKEFQFSVKGFSSISMTSFIEKMKKIQAWDGKGKQPAYTACESAMLPFFNKYQKVAGSVDAYTKLLDASKKLKKEMRDTEKNLQYEKIAMLLTNSDFKDQTERGKLAVDLGEYQVSIDMKETPVYF